MPVGIVRYGSYVPSGRLTVAEIALQRGHDAQRIQQSLQVSQKAVAGSDEDTATIAVAAAQEADAGSFDIGAVYVGSESHPYAVKPTSTIVGDALGLGDDFFTADMEFACKGGTAALQVCYGLVKAGMTPYALAIGADVAQARPGDILEYTAAAGGAAFVVGSQDVIATIEDTISVTTNTPDFWRRSLQPYPEHTNRFTGKPSYFKHITMATKKILHKTGMSVQGIDHVVFHQPNGKFPKIAAKMLGFSAEQLAVGLAVHDIGNTYSASSLIGLTRVLDRAKPGQIILVVSYGSGAGSDALLFKMTQYIANENCV